MNDCRVTDLLITGLGVTSAIGQGKAEFCAALLAGRHDFRGMQRPGRQRETPFIGAEISEMSCPKTVNSRTWKTASLAAQAALLTLEEAWEEAGLQEADPARIGLIIGGSNLQQRQMLLNWQAYGERPAFVRPTYGLSFMDSDLCGLCTEHFNIRGLAYTVGGASASGHVAILQAIQAVESGQLDICIALGALMDLSYMEIHALRAMGAMGTDRFHDDPARACRPFDRQRDGFIYGENCGAVVIEKRQSAEKRQTRPLARLAGWAVAMDGNRNPNPSTEGEVRVVKQSLARAGFTARQIDYINPHGTGSLIGDQVELEALTQCGLSHVAINASKSVIGHGLSAAGTVEVIATLVQMAASRLHPSRNLDDPINTSFHWVREHSREHRIQRALNLSMGFGGINTAICLQREEP